MCSGLGATLREQPRWLDRRSLEPELNTTRPRRQFYTRKAEYISGDDNGADTTTSTVSNDGIEAGAVMGIN